MTLRSYLLIMIGATIICWSSFLVIIFNTDPNKTNWLGFLLFYSCLFLALIGTSTIIGFVIRFITLKYELAFRSVKIAFRQSFLFSFLIIAILFLLAHDLFTWLNLIFLILGLSVLEFFLISYSNKPNNIGYDLDSEEDI